MHTRIRVEILHSVNLESQLTNLAILGPVTHEPEFSDSRLTLNSDSLCGKVSYGKTWRKTACSTAGL